MLSYDQALAQILDAISPLPASDVPLLDALGRTLAADVVSTLSLPPFDNSAMDGYAVRFRDVEGATLKQPRLLPVAGTVAAGDANPVTLPVGAALRIMTGAPLPAGADTVIPIEDTAIDGEQVAVRDPGTHGQFVRTAGGDAEPGDTMLRRGSTVRPQEVAVAAALGLRALPVHRRPRVAIISTGDELVEPGEALAFGQIYNSNAYALAAQVADAGGHVTVRRLAGDTREALRAAFDACAGTDIIITSGGVSVGEFDYVRAVWAERGTLDFWQVAIRPGKPLAFGAWGDRRLFGLPGNPVSSLVTFELFVRPALRRMMGAADPARPSVQATLAEAVSHQTGRRSFLRGAVTESETGWVARAHARQGSHQLSVLPQTNALLVVPEEVETLPIGAPITALLLD